MSAYTEARGFPPYDPAMMVALLLYGYSRGVYSSRRIARGWEERLDFQAVTALNQPDFRTISEFCVATWVALGELFVQVLADGIPLPSLVLFSGRDLLLLCCIRDESPSCRPVAGYLPSLPGRTR